MLLTHVSCQLAILADAGPPRSFFTAASNQAPRVASARPEPAQRSLPRIARRLRLSRWDLPEAPSQN